ncbi:hypothetical protein FNU76_15795 [Chitinimonas arctica]|uniref:Uncharacterized protein n=1 Tax=Chitinimonas arctica TaxID=2594795 RepID=A0A516SHR4_9NEIS|nr:hypothetical protein [Chitinimonas arctica]QDQ27694.1 hypothetical protein FNU76_15795 [Chitinimonas arctica]
MQKQLALSVGVISLAVLGWVAWYATKGDLRPTAQAGAEASTPSTTMKNHAFPYFESEADYQPAFSADNLAASYKNAKNLYEFEQEALKHPKEGGYFYASLAALACQAEDMAKLPTQFNAESNEASHLPDKYIQNHVARGSAEWNAIYSMRNASMQRYKEKCKNFPPAKRGAMREYLERLDQGMRLGDPLALIDGGRQLGKIGAEEALKLKIASQDPEALRNLSLAMISKENSDGQSSVAYFDGRWWSDDAKLFDAASLAYCEFGASCKIESDLRLMGDCILGGSCYASKIETVRLAGASGEPLTPEEMKEVLELRDRIVKAIRNKDMAAFIPPKQ